MTNSTTTYTRYIVHITESAVIYQIYVQCGFIDQFKLTGLGVEWHHSDFPGLTGDRRKSGLILMKYINSLTELERLLLVQEQIMTLL